MQTSRIMAIEEQTRRAKARVAPGRRRWALGRRRWALGYMLLGAALALGCGRADSGPVQESPVEESPVGQGPAESGPSISRFSPREAPYGTPLTLLGEGFSAVLAENTVTFNGIQAVVVEASPRRLRVLVPQNKACSGPLQVEVGGQTAQGGIFTYVPTPAVRTLAADGPWRWPTGIAVDPAGNLYVLSSTDNNLYKISMPQEEVSLFAGPVPGMGGLATDASGNLFVTAAPLEGAFVYKITPDGELSTVAGGSIGYVDSAQGAPLFSRPKGVAVDAEGNLYVADCDNKSIRQITPAGTVSTVAQVVGFPEAVAVDAAGNLYVTAVQLDGMWLHKITPEGFVSTLASNEGCAGPCFRPIGLAMDAADNLYVAHGYPDVPSVSWHSIERVSPEGQVHTVVNGWPGHAGSQGGEPLLDTPSAIAVDADGNLYVTDYFNNRIGHIVFE